MASNKNKYDVVVLSHGLPSVLSTMDYINKNMSVLFLNNLEQRIIEYKGIKLYPYEHPISSLSEQGYSDDHQELFMETKETLGVIFDGKRFDFFEKSIKEEITNLFPEDEKPFNSFITDILKSKFVSKISNISQLYDKHELSVGIRGLLDAILFAFSGVETDKFPTVRAVKILGFVLRGLSVPKDGTFCLREQALKVLSQKIKVDGDRKGLPVKGQGKLIMSDHDHIKTAFLDNILCLKNEYSDTVLYPYSIYVKIPRELVPSQMNRWSIFIGTDKSMILNKNDVYMIRLFMEDKEAVIRVSCFMGYGCFDVDHSVHKSKSLKMYEILRSLIPVIDVFDTKVFPNAESADFVSELEILLASLKYGDLVYKGIPGKIKRSIQVLRG